MALYIDSLLPFRSFVSSFVGSLVCWFLRSFVRTFLRSFVPSFFPSFLPSFLHSFAYSFLSHTIIHSAILKTSQLTPGQISDSLNMRHCGKEEFSTSSSFSRFPLEVVTLDCLFVSSAFESRMTKEQFRANSSSKAKSAGIKEEEEEEEEEEEKGK